MIEFVYFPGNGSHRSRILIAPSHVVIVIEGDSGRDGQQCWLRMVNSSTEWLVSGSMDEIAAKLNGGYDPAKQGEPS